MMNVLLAEDEITIAVTLGDALEDAGHRVVHAPTTSVALRALECETVQAVLCDIRMPGAGGFAVLRRSLELDPLRPVIMMTGYATEEVEREARALGAVAFLRKPFRNDSIVRMLARAG